MANKMSVDSLAWIPATSTQARYNIPGELMYGNGKAAWLPVTVSQLESDGINALFTLEWDNSIKIKAKIKDCLARHDDQIQDDLTLLQMPNEASILYNLGNRFRDGHNVTSFGRYFISVNPCHSLIRKNGMYQNSVSNMHALFSSEPSVNMFSIAVKSRNTIVDRLLNQTVIMRGCSGSGKTESTKEILQYLLYCDNPRRDGPSNQSDNYQALGHAQNPLIINNSCNISKAVSSIVSIFDYFGSASTDKNLNSSRLLKCIRLLYKIGGKLAGVESSYFMLDTSRLSLADTESCPAFKIFTILCHGLPARVVTDELKLTSSMKDSLVGSSQHGGGGIDTREGCERELQHFHSLLSAVGVTPSQISSMNEILSAILHLQSLSISGGDGSASFSASSKASVGHAERLLKLESSTLGPALLKKTVEISGSKNVTDLNPQECRSAVNGLSAELYQRLMQFLLKTSENFGTETNNSEKLNSLLTLQIIDGPGNEWLENTPNRLAQFCINMAEEKFHEQYIIQAFQRELSFLRSEGVDLPSCEIRDCETIATVVERPPSGIVSLLEEACMFPRGNDDAMLDKIFSSHSKTKLVKAAADRNAKKTVFVIKHSFGDVQYDADGFVAANKEKASVEILALLNGPITSAFPILRSTTVESPPVEAAPPPPPSGASKARNADKSVAKGSLIASRTRDQLNVLLQSISGTEEEGMAEPIVVQCLRPSADPRSYSFDPGYTINQIRYLNIADVTDFSKKCYPLRQKYSEFYDRYRLMFPYNFSGLPWKMTANQDKKVLCKSLIRECANLGCITSVFEDPKLSPLFGNTVIFFRTELISQIDKLRNEIILNMTKAATLIQASTRTKLQAMKYKQLCRSVNVLQALFRMLLKRKSYRSTIASARKIQGFYMTKKLSKDFKNLRDACNVIKRCLLGKMIQRLRYQRIMRTVRAMQMMSRGFIIRQNINHVLRSVLTLQAGARNFLKRNRIHYFKLSSILKIQRVFRGSLARSLNRPIVRVLKIRRNQRRGTAAVKKLQAHWRKKMISMRLAEIVNAAKVIQQWIKARKSRWNFLKVLFLAKWLQCSARRLSAVNETNMLRVKNMLEEESLKLERLREQELKSITYHSTSAQDMLGLQLGGGFYRNNHEKFGRFLIGLDVLFDTEIAYPNGWLQTILDFDKMCRNSGQKRLSHIAVGRMHTVLVDSGHNVFTVGLGDCGQLGHGGKSNEIKPRRLETLSYQAGQQEGRGLNRGLAQHIEVKSVAAGRDHTLLLSASGNVYSWGGNRRGQLGHSEFNSSALPRIVIGVKNVKTIACGSYHSVCLADPGIVFTWGARECLGRHSTTDSCEVASLPFFVKRRVHAMVSGDIHVTVRSGMEFYSWGQNLHGQLGSESVPADNSSGETAECVLPVLVNISTASWGEADAMGSILVAGGRHVLLAVRNKLWAWGWNKYGQVGCGTMTVNISTPVRVNIPGSNIIAPHSKCGQNVASHIVHVGAGWRHSLIMTKGGQLFVWGHAGLHAVDVRGQEMQQEQKKDTPHGIVTEEMKLEFESGPNCLRVPHSIQLPQKMSSRSLLGSFATYSNTISITTVELEEPIEPKAPLTKEKHVSTRKVESLKYHEGTEVQNELNRRLRAELGGWGKSACIKTQQPTNGPSVLSETPKSSAGDLKRQDSMNRTTSFNQTQNGTTSQQNLRKSYDREREGTLTDDSLLALFSPLKHTNIHSPVPHINKNVFDYFSMHEDGRVDNETEYGDDISNMNSVTSPRGGVQGNRRASTSTKRSNSPLSKLNRRRRTSLAVVSTAEFSDMLPLNQANNTTSITLKTNNIRPIEISRQEPISKKTTLGQTGGKKNNNSQFTSEIDSLQKDIYQKRSQSKLTLTRSNSANSKFSHDLGSPDMILSENYNHNTTNQNDGSLSLVTVSDLATMIQSIKKESMKEMSMSWRH